MTTTIDCNTVTLNQAQYRHIVTAVPFNLIPLRLAKRMEIKMVEASWFNAQMKGFEKELVTTLDTIKEVTGLDKFYWLDGDKYFVLSFKPVVVLKTFMGEGIIESCSDEFKVENSPVADFDYQDATFDSNIKKMLEIIRSINY